MFVTNVLLFLLLNSINDDSNVSVNGDGQYYYPCEHGMPCATTRISNIRDGLEDWEMFRRIKNKTQVLALIRSVVRGASDWTTDPHAIEMTRRAALELLVRQQQQQQPPSLY